MGVSEESTYRNELCHASVRETTTDVKEGVATSSICCQLMAHETVSRQSGFLPLCTGAQRVEEPRVARTQVKRFLFSYKLYNLYKTLSPLAS